MNDYNAVLARNTENAPKSVGPYSQTVAYSHYNHISEIGRASCRERV